MWALCADAGAFTVLVLGGGFSDRSSQLMEALEMGTGISVFWPVEKVRRCGSVWVPFLFALKIGQNSVVLVKSHFGQKPPP
jgi:hypothetical protein